MDNYLMAERGGVYTFNNGKEDRECIVVSSGRRHKDNIISVLFLTTDRGNISDDVVRFDIVRGEHDDEFWENTRECVRTDLVTYTKRMYLKKKIGQVPESLMKKIDKGIMRSLGLWEE